MTKSEAQWYLAGLFDGEGCVPSDGQRYIDVMANTDLILLRSAEEALEVLGFRWKQNRSQAPRKSHHRTCFKVRINHKADQIRFLETIPFKSEEKRLRFESFLRHL